jgi:glutamate:GABA antiporter
MAALDLLSTLFSLLISAYPFVSVVNPRTYAIKILSTILLSNCAAVTYYLVRTRTAGKEKAAFSNAA